MRTDFWLCALVGVASATAMVNRKDDGYEAEHEEEKDSYPAKTYEEKDSYPAKTYEEKDPYPVQTYEEKDPYPVKTYEETNPYPAKTYEAKKSHATKYPKKPAKPGHDYKSYNEDEEDEEDYNFKPDDHEDDKDQYASYAAKKGYSTKPYDRGDKEPWHPKTSHPEFFSLRVDEKCDDGEFRTTTCRFDNYAIRLEQGIVIATPYNRWWDPKLPIFFVDDDTELYTVSKKPLQLYIDTVTGALRYAAVGWLPSNSIAYSFYKTGNNPLDIVDPSPAHLSWPSTQGNTFLGGGPWIMCALGNTGQYQVFVSNENYQSNLASGVYKDPGECYTRSLAAINASPWKNGGLY